MRDDVKRRIGEMLCTGRLVNLDILFPLIPEKVSNEIVEEGLVGHGQHDGRKVYIVDGLRPPENGKPGICFDGIRQAFAAAYIMHYLLQLQDVALTWEQVQEMDLPPNPAKLTDTRAVDFIAQYGYDSYELDAIAPADMAEMVRNAVLENMDLRIYNELRETQAQEREALQEIIEGLE